MSQALPDPLARRETARVATLAREVTFVLTVALAIAASARIVFPLGFTPVPVTVQTFVVLLAGTLVGARRAGSGALTYLAFGIAGVPWFATGGATLGYVAGFVLAAHVVGRAADAGMLATRRSALGVMAGAHALIYVFGATWLALFLGIGPSASLALGVLPFLVGDSAKVVAAAMIAPRLVRMRG